MYCITYVRIKTKHRSDVQNHKKCWISEGKRKTAQAYIQPIYRQFCTIFKSETKSCESICLQRLVQQLTIGEAQSGSYCRDKQPPAPSQSSLSSTQWLKVATQSFTHSLHFHISILVTPLPHSLNAQCSFPHCWQPEWPEVFWHMMYPSTSVGGGKQYQCFYPLLMQPIHGHPTSLIFSHRTPFSHRAALRQKSIVETPPVLIMTRRCGGGVNRGVYV